MKTLHISQARIARYVSAMLLFSPVFSAAQVPVDDDGNVIGNYESQAEIMPLGEDGIPRLSSYELQELVGPVALYPDDLLAIVLPAAAYPLQIAAAARFLEAHENDPTLKPDPDWDDSIVALTNYPEVVELLNKDLDWTYRLGEAVVAQQNDVVAAVEAFRDRAYAAGNLKSDSYQTVSNDAGTIHIEPTAEDVIYVPYYEPERVVVYQPRPVYYYYPRPCPVYYYPYAANHYFNRGYFWGVTTAFSIGWISDSLHVYHHSYRGHPYYGRTYWDNWWYRRPSINIYNTTYVNRGRLNNNRYHYGDIWRARDNRREYTVREGYARDDNRRPVPASQNARSGNARATNLRPAADTAQRPVVGTARTRPPRGQDRVRGPIAFRERPNRPAAQVQNPRSGRPTSSSGTTRPRDPVATAGGTSRGTTRPAIQFRDRDVTAARGEPGARPSATNRREPVVRPGSSRPQPVQATRKIRTRPVARNTTPTVTQRVTAARTTTERRPTAGNTQRSQNRVTQSRPTQNRATQSRPTQSRPTQSRATQSRPTQSRSSESRSSDNERSSARSSRSRQQRR